jgi:cytochrome c-type biogenesis protein CcmH
MKRLGAWLPVLVLLVVLAGALVVGSTRDSAPPSASRRVAHIARDVRCPTCEGLSANESESPASKAIRDQIRSKVEAGYSDGEIRAYLVDRYGKDILLKPEGTGVSTLVWALPVAGLVASVAGLFLVFRRWRRRRVDGQVSDDDRALVAAAPMGQSEELDFVLSSLADLEAERAAGDIDEPDYVSLRDDYTARAAALVRGPRPSAGVRTVERKRLRPALVALAVLAMAGGAGLAVARTAGERVPGAEAAGGITDTGPGEKLSRAAALAGQGNLLEAIKLYDEVIKEDPENAQALAYRGWLVRLAGKQGGDTTLIDKGLAFIDRAIAADPGYPDAHFFRGEILLRDKNDPAGAVPEFRAFLDGGGDPDMSTLVQGELQAALESSGQK